MISGYLSNAHAKLGYTASDDAPTLPLRIVPGRNEWGGHTHRVVDAEDAWMADFRNPTDARRFVASYGVKELDPLAVIDKALANRPQREQPPQGNMAAEWPARGVPEAPK